LRKFQESIPLLLKQLFYLR